MRLADDISNKVRAGMAGIYVVSQEHEDAIRELAQLCADNAWAFGHWDAARGLVDANDVSLDVRDGLKIFDFLPSLREDPPKGDEPQPVLVVIRNATHLLRAQPVFVQAAINAIWTGKQNGHFCIFLAPTLFIPPELERHLVVVEHELPNKEQLRDTICETLADDPSGLPKDDDSWSRLLNAAAGLTQFETENAVALSFLQNPEVRPQDIWTYKAQGLKKTGFLTLYSGTEDFSSIGGMDAIKDFHLRALQQPSDNPLFRARGTLLLGVPGAGKSALAKALGNEVSRPVLMLDVGGLLGGLVGQSEQNVRYALRLADAMAPCVLYVDEVEKCLPHGTSGHDSGVGSRLLGTMLTWLNDHTSDVFFIATCNNIQALTESHPEFARAERFDGIFMIDVPTAAERVKIWAIYTKLFELSESAADIDADGWTGAEIRACCRLAKVLKRPLKEAAHLISPLSRTATTQLTALREWAEDRCLAASYPGLYHRQRAGDPATNGSTARRRLRKE